jgi:iron(III) transport system substrate-binding protein
MKPSRKTLAITGLVIPALLLAACSSSGSGGGSGSSGGNSSAAGSSGPAPGAAAASAAAGTGAYTPTAAETQVCNAAKSEKTLNIRDSTDTDVFAKEIAPFQKLYPWIKVNFTSQKPQDDVPVIVSEVQAHHTLDTDAVKMDIPGATPLLTQHLLVSGIDWASLGVPATQIAAPDGVSTPRTERLTLGLSYNTQKFKPSDLPNTWDELINAKWAHQVIVDPRAEQLGGLAASWGMAKTVDWYKKFLATDKPVVVAGATASLQKVISGEIDLSTSGHDAEVAEQKASGAPIGLKYLDVAPVQDNYGFVLANAPHPNAAKCFIAWYANPNGGGIEQAKYEYKANQTTPTGLPSTTKLAAPTDPKTLELVANTADALAKLTPQ